MRIAYVSRFAGAAACVRQSRHLDNHSGGAQKIRVIARALLRAGHDVHILSGGVVAGSNRFYRSYGERMSFPEGETQVHYCPLLDVRGLQRLMVCWGLPRLLRQEHRRTPFDAVVVYNISEETLLTSRVARQLGIPVVLEYEDDVLSTRRPDGRTAKWRMWMNTRILRQLNHLLGGALVVCPELGAQLNTENRGVVRGALDEDLLLATEQPPPSLRSGERARVLYCGGLSHDKGVDLLIEALFHVQHPVDLHITGSGPMEADLRRRASELPDRHRAVIHGFVLRAEMLARMTEAHVLVNPHRMHVGEGFLGKLFPFKLVEYAAAGAPVVSSCLGQLEESWMHQINIFDTDDAMALAEMLEKVLANHSAARVASLAAREQVRAEYSCAALAQRLTGVLVRACELHSRCSAPGRPNACGTST